MARAGRMGENVYSVGKGVVVSLGLSPCKTQVRLVAAYGKPLKTTSEQDLGIVTWIVRRALSSDGAHVWEARAYRCDEDQKQVLLLELGGLSFCRSMKFGSLLWRLGLNMAMARPSLMGSQMVFGQQIDCGQLPLGVSEIRATPGYVEMEMR